MTSLYGRSRSLVSFCAPLRAVKSLKGKSNASARWIRRQWSDPMVKQAKREGLRSRAAFKLRELNDVRLDSEPEVAIQYANMSMEHSALTCFVEVTWCSTWVQLLADGRK